MKKNFIPLAGPLLLLIPAFLLHQGCSHNVTQPNFGVPSPTFTVTSTGTPTIGPSSTPTKTPTSTASGTPTLSPTQTGTSTQTGTPTSTVANATPTSTPTDTATGTPSATATSTTAIQGDIFNSSVAVSNWPPDLVYSSVVTAGTGLTVVYNPSYTGCSASGSMEVTAGFTGSNQNATVKRNLASPVDLSGKTITVLLQVSSGYVSTAFVGGQIFIQQGGTAGSGTAYASLYQVGAAFPAGVSGASACVTMSLTIPNSATNVNTSNYSIYNGPFDPQQVQTWGLQIYSGGGGSGQTTNVIDVQSWLYL